MQWCVQQFHVFWWVSFRDPRVSSERLKTMMEGRRLIRLSSIHKTRSIDLDGDWVTMGVIVSKTDPKVSAKARIIGVV